MTNNPEKETSATTADDQGKYDGKHLKGGSYLRELLEKRNNQHQHHAGEILNVASLQSLDHEGKEDEGSQEQQDEDEVTSREEQKTNYGKLNETDQPDKVESSSNPATQQQHPITQFLQIPSQLLPGSEEQPPYLFGLEPPNSSRSASSVSSTQPPSPSFIWRPIMPGYTSEKGTRSVLP